MTRKVDVSRMLHGDWAAWQSPTASWKPLPVVVPAVQPGRHRSWRSVSSFCDKISCCLLHQQTMESGQLLGPRQVVQLEPGAACLSHMGCKV